MRRLLPLLILLMPLAAAAQTVGDAPLEPAQYLLLQQQATERPAELGSAVTTPVWLGTRGQVLSLTTSDQTATGLPSDDLLLSFPVVNPSRVTSVGLQYGLDPHLQIHASVDQRSWADRAPRVIGSEVGATYVDGRYSLGLSVGADRTPSSATLPRVLPGAVPGVSGLIDFASSAQLNARGRVALDNKSGIDLGASVGRIRLLPGNLLGVNTLDQKALSFGVDHGPLTGSIVGRTMQPSIPGGLYADKRWNSIDLGVTWRLPWQGQLSIGAQNVWSSGSSVNTPVGPEPDQSRTPYVQYHQDL